MLNKKMTRRDFLKTAWFGVFAVFLLPSLKQLSIFKKSYKEARHYERLAG